MAFFVVPLWEGPAPLSRGGEPGDIPTLTIFLPEGTTGPTPALVIAPGGGYGRLAFAPQGTSIAQWWQKRGVAGFVLKYRLAPDGYRHPVPLLDAQRALRLVRSRAAEWKLDPTK